MGQQLDYLRVPSSVPGFFDFMLGAITSIPVTQRADNIRQI